MATARGVGSGARDRFQSTIFQWTLGKCISLSEPQFLHPQNGTAAFRDPLLHPCINRVYFLNSDALTDIWSLAKTLEGLPLPEAANSWR